ncbi:BMP-binding endothelial regulator protein [Bienertia sinuspersici]
MKVSNINCLLLIIILVLISASTTQASSISLIKVVPGHAETRTCFSRRSPCFLKRITCPRQCPTSHPKDPKAKACYIDCYSPICKAECRNRKPNCSGRGAACLDPRFIGGDGIVFYFHGKSNEHFALVSDHKLQINARFIGLRPFGRTRDYTWIQALGILINSHTISLEATPAAAWDKNVEHLKFTYDGDKLDIPQGNPSSWKSSNEDLKIERIESRNSEILIIKDVAEISVNVVPVTKEDDHIHNYHIPPDDCFAHLEVQFKFLELSQEVEGVLGRTYQPDFKNPAKPGVAMPIVGGEDRYRTSSLSSADCKSCLFSPVVVLQQNLSLKEDLGTVQTAGAT